jgi:hypothetical protein
MLSRLPKALSLLLFVAATCINAAPLNSLDNARAPALAPRDVPIILSNTSRDRRILPAQICGVVGGYIATVLIWGILLLTVGRRMRRRTENSPKALELELVTARPPVKTPASPHSVRSATSWLKKSFKKDKLDDSAVSSPTSPVVHSPGSFDRSVVEADRERAQAEMERLYAAVMEHDRKKSYSQVSVTDGETASNDRRPTKIDTSMEISTHSNPASPVRAIYPPGYLNGPPSAPLPRDNRLHTQYPPASPRSILSKRSHMSNHSASSNRTARFNLKNLRISGPIQKYPGDTDDEARTPLSPRFYNPGAPPSPPTQQNSPTTPGDIEEAYEQLDQVQPLPRPAPQRLNSASSQSQDPGLHIPTINMPRSATSSNASLPLRGYAEPLKSPDLRTTVLDRRLDKLSLTTPKTGVPYTPYSPYMPFTPLTPVTPHLVTKKERKSRAKEDKRKGTGGEMVQSPKDMFGDGW